MVSEAFRELFWKFEAIDIDEYCNANTNMDILNLNFKDLPFTPDFVHVSLPCETYSRMTGGKDRTKETFAKTERAREHDNLLLKVITILNAAKALHPHLLVCIENPVGMLRHMPSESVCC